MPVRRPTIDEVEPKSVRLSWQRVDVPATGLDEEPLRYMIEMQEPPLQSWRELVSSVQVELCSRNEKVFF